VAVTYVNIYGQTPMRYTRPIEADMQRAVDLLTG
jgi:hypothetical protein